MNLVSGGGVNAFLEFCKIVDDGRNFDDDLTGGYSERVPYPFQEAGLPTHGSEQKENAASKRLIGTIEKYDQPIPGAVRILQAEHSTGPETKIGRGMPDEIEVDLILKLIHFKGYPSVPGYKLVAIDPLKKRYYFNYDADNDPYLPDETPLRPEAISRLIQNYVQAEHYELMQAIAEQEGLTLSQCIRLSQQHSAHRYRKIFEPDLGPTLTNMAAFRSFIHDGQLRGTCHIFNQFGAFSEGVLWPEDRAFVTGGFVLDADAKAISAVGHAQVARISNSGKATLTDWSPIEEGDPEYRYKGSLDSNQEKPPLESRWSTPAGEASPVTLKDQVNTTVRSLLGQLSILFMPELGATAPKDLIFQKIKGLGYGHPITETIGALLRAKDALEQHETLPDECVQALLGAAAKLEQERERSNVRRQARPDLDMLNTTLQTVITHLDLRGQVDRLQGMIEIGVVATSPRQGLNF